VNGVIDSTCMTVREREVLRLLAWSWTAARIGRELRISERTVHKHLENLYGKLGVHDRLAAVLRAQELGLLDPSADPARPVGHPPRRPADSRNHRRDFPVGSAHHIPY
jgi:DNA-binding CsgD family transcriptional regulator